MFLTLKKAEKTELYLYSRSKFKSTILFNDTEEAELSDFDRLNLPISSKEDKILSPIS